MQPLATRTEALRRMNDFIPAARLYGRDRNFVKIGHDHVSRLSSFLRHRILLEQELADAAIVAHGFSKVEKFVQEIYWRRYWKSWLSLRPQVWGDYLQYPPANQTNPDGAKALAVMNGASGNQLVDYFTHELIATGYLHNHARMWYAAWWVHHARLPWQWGAAWFMRHLIDGDPASNTLSWRWVAGLQTPGKTYLARRANIEKYLDPQILAKVSPSMDDFEHPAPWISDTVTRPEITMLDLPKAEPLPNLKTGLWIHEEDLSAEGSPLADLKIEALVATGHRAGWLRHQYASARVQWLESALIDACHRASIHWQKPCRLELPDDLASFLVRWARLNQLGQIVTLRPDIGPLADSLHAVQSAMEAAGIHLSMVDRPQDLYLRPLAKRGFFDFWKKCSVRIQQAFEPDLFSFASDFPS